MPHSKTTSKQIQLKQVAQGCVASSDHLQACCFLQHFQETLSNFMLKMGFFLMSNQNFLCCNLCLLLFVLSLCAFKSLSPPCLYHYTVYIMSLLSLLFPKAQQTEFLQCLLTWHMHQNPNHLDHTQLD